ncbi:MAG: TOMM precursor leader peptide-binding protein [Acidiferrobacterales bacterium]|nr:TOMM precursor leader peptide-binding protein [Acidiferrobacterales bacterium]
MKVDSGSSILRKFTVQDTGLVDVPLLSPHIEFHCIDGDRTLLVSETFNTLLNGVIVSNLLPLLDGRRTRQEICNKLDGRFSESEIHKTLTALSARGYIVSGEHTLDSAVAAFWTSLGASPRWVQTSLSTFEVSVHGDNDGNLAQQLQSMGIPVKPHGRTLAIHMCTDYLDTSIVEINRSNLQSRIPWILIKPNGIVPLFGPVFHPGDNRPCWACIAYRLQGHEEVHNFLRNVTGSQSVFVPRAAQQPISAAIVGLAVAEIAKWRVFDGATSLDDHVISINSARLQIERHRAMHRPQCSECGLPNLSDPARQPLPVKLKPSPKLVNNSGGTRSVSPQRTLERYRHLVSPVSGVVTWLKTNTNEPDSWLHVHTSGSNFALKSRKLSSLRRSLRSKTVGKGSTKEQSEASALCEAIERYSCAYHGDEIRCRKSLSELTDSEEMSAIHPNEVQLFSDDQIDHADEINARNHPYNIIPDRFDDQLVIDWSPIWSLTRKRHRYLPTCVMYSMLPEQRELTNLAADSNGCAAGNTLEEAIFQGFLELVERDAFAIWWYNRLRMPEVSLDSFHNEYLSQAKDYYECRNRNLWVLDVTNDIGIPVFVAISQRTDKESEDIIYAAGAHTDPQVAALRAVCELNQFLNLVEPQGPCASGYRVDDPMSLWWFKNAKIATQSYLAPSSELPSRTRCDYRTPDTEDLLDDLEYCRSIIESKGMEFLVLDNTRPDIGMPVVRVVVPGLRHFWERFAPGRLYDVPVDMAWRDSPLEESQLNPIPVIA